MTYFDHNSKRSGGSPTWPLVEADEFEQTVDLERDAHGCLIKRTEDETGEHVILSVED